MSCDYDLYKDYHLYIFDLDYTILLHSAEANYRKEYEKKLTKFLEDLKRNGKILTLVTYNCNPKFYLEELGIDHLFSYIYSPYLTTFENYISPEFDINMLDNSTIWIRKDIVTINKKKQFVIEELLGKFDIPKHKAIFFDDHKIHINSVEELGIKSVLSDPLLGIPFTNKIDLKTISK